MDLPDSGIELGSPALQANSLPTELLQIALRASDCTLISQCFKNIHQSVQFISVAESCPTFCDPMNCSTPGLPVHHQILEFTQTHAPESVMPSSHLILCRPFLLLPSIFPNIRFFSNESALCIRRPKYQNFSFNISLSNEHPGLISFRMDWRSFRLSLKSKGLSRVFSNTTVQKLQFFCAQLSL